MAEGPPVKVDMEGRQSVSLFQILESFSAPLNEEQTWAVCHQSSLYLQKAFKTKKIHGGIGSGLDSLLLHKDGLCSVELSQSSEVAGNNKNGQTERCAIYELGLVIYSALDYGIVGDDERTLSSDLQTLLERMTEGNSHDDQESVDLSVDEGIADEQDFNESEELEDVIFENNNIKNDGIQNGQLSDDGLLVTNGADHSELPTTGKEQNCIKDDGISSLTSFTHVLQVCASHLPHPTQAISHYQAVVRALVAEVQELTTFLEKISSGKKNLQKITHKVHEKNDVSTTTTTELMELGIHDWARLWMQVIKQLRTGVQLKKSGERRRAPIEYELTPYEMILDDIRSRKFILKQVMIDGEIPPQVKKDAHDVILDFIRSRPPLKPVNDRILPPVSPRRPSTFERMLDEIKSVPRLKPTPRRQEYKFIPIDFGDNSLTPEPENQPIKTKISFADLVIDWDNISDDSEDDGVGYNRLYNEEDESDEYVNISMSESPSQKLTYKMPFTSSPNQAPVVGSPRRHSITICETPKHSMHDWNDPIEYLSLTVDEVKHIRSVHCKAELEDLQCYKKVYLDVLNEKVCFNCKIRFALFNRKYKCKLCKKIICSRCCRRMKIPSEHFLHIPIHALSPCASPTKCLPKTSLQLDFDEEDPRSESAPATPACSPTMGRRSIWGRSASSNMKDICTECKAFMIQVFQTNRHTTIRR
ncbi:protein spire homolog 1-like [Saccoglossus kowalevskii]|uniref:Protein spire-like n=1 Tax=Saccoglossus kowalevskii TaxID=10224 RepID=A0ABM0MA73_SACKO|nr:PREDICTED: protein spire-like [Saccoglossus kowalevskii]